MSPPGGRAIRRASWAGTALFAVTALGAAIWPDGLEVLAASVALVLFLVGCGVFVWSMVVAAGRSREHQLSVAGVYLLSGSAPAGVRRSLLGAVLVESVVAVATATARPFTSLAFGVLVPMWGLGLAGLWGAIHGTFPRRGAAGPRVGDRPPLA